MTEQSLLAWLNDTRFFGISLANATLAILAALVAYMVMTLGLRFALRRAATIASRTTNRADDVLVEVMSGTSRFLLLMIAVLIGVGMLELPERWQGRVGQLWFIALALQFALWVNRAIGIGLRRHLERNATSNGQASAAATLLSWGLRTLLWAVVLLAMLSNLGVNITAFIASLGVGGIAIALAAQNVLGDLFASLSIAVDKPFEVGDAIGFDGFSGTVENVGVKTTRIRSAGGEQIIMSNTDLLKKTISNYKRLMRRRVVFSFGITYDTPPETVEAIPAIVKRLVQEHEKLRFDRAHFKTFGASSLDYEVVYFVESPDYGLFMDQQQRINLALMRELKALGVEFAFPSRTIYMAGGAVPPAERASSTLLPAANPG